jgi:hypothetical protein
MTTPIAVTQLVEGEIKGISQHQFIVYLVGRIEAQRFIHAIQCTKPKLFV